MSDAAWQRDMAQLVEERIGVRLRTDEPESLVQFVAARVRALNLSRPGSYVNYLRAEARDGPEFSRLTAVCTNGQTFFNRDETQLRAAVLAVKELFAAQQRPLWIWSAGCASGEEPYSMALLLYQTGLPAYIMASDINAEALGAAQKAVYVTWSLRNVSEEIRERFFAQQEERYILKDKVRNMVEFCQHNLVVDPIPPPRGGPAGWDIILCRNVFIYYAPATTAQVLTRMAAALQPNGWLFIGASETVQESQVPLRAQDIGGRVALRRRGPTPVPPVAPLQGEKAPAPAAAVTPHQGYQEAILLLAKSDRAAALTALQAVTAGQPDHVLAWLLLGHVWLQQHTFDNALEAYTQAQARGPLWAEIHYFQGLVHRKLNNLEQAEQALRRALFLEPDYWPASYLLAGIFDRQGRPSLSRRELLHTQNAIRSSRTAPFRSYVDFSTALRLSASEVLTACAQRLAPAKRA